MRHALALPVSLTILVCIGCASLADIHAVSLDWGTSWTVDANADLVKKAARTALTKGKCDIEEDTQVNEKTSMIIGLTGMNIVTIAPTMGIWCRFVIEQIGDGKTSARLYTKIRDPNDVFAKSAISSVEKNVGTYFTANVEELLADEPHPAQSTVKPPTK